MDDMKCIRHDETGEVARVSNEEAKRLVEHTARSHWRYVTKLARKAHRKAVA